MFAPVRTPRPEWLGGPEASAVPFAAFLGALFIGYIYLEYRYEYDERATRKAARRCATSATTSRPARPVRVPTPAQPARRGHGRRGPGRTGFSPVLLPDANPTARRRTENIASRAWIVFALFALFGVGIVARTIQLDPNTKRQGHAAPAAHH